MYFTFKLKNISFSGETLYIQDQLSLIYRPHNTNAGVGILIGAYTELDTICETSEVVHISGLNPKNTWITRRLIIPEAKPGRIYAHFSSPSIKGTGVSYDRTWSTYFDYEKQYICIGDYQTSESDNCVEFANGAIAVLRFVIKMIE